MADLNITRSESIDVADQATAQLSSLSISISESIAVSEYVEVQGPGGIFVSESIVVTEWLKMNRAGDIKVSESISVADSVLTFLTGEGSILRFTLNDVLLVDLNAPPYFPLEFSSEAPLLRTQRLASSLEDGENVLYSRYNNVVQPIKILVGGDSNEDVQQSIEILEEVCSKVATSFSVESIPVMLEYKPKEAQQTWGTKVITATLVSEFDRVQEPTQRVASPLHSYTQYSIITIQIERNFYWQGPLTDLEISNSHGSGVAGVPVFNCNDSTHDNWIDIAEHTVDGGLPTPAEIRMYNGSWVPLTNYMLSLNARFSPDTFVHILEGEDASWKAGTSSVETSSKYSSGEALKLVPGGTPGQEIHCASWNLSSTLLELARSRWFHVLMYTIESQGLDEDDLIQLRVSSGDVEVSNTPWRTYGKTKKGLIMDCGALRLPPFVIGNVPSQDLTLKLYVRSDTDITFYLDFFQLSPASSPDGFVNMVPYNFAVPMASTIVHDGPREAAYEETSAGKAGAWFTMEGGYIYLQPVVAQRLLVLVNNEDGDVPITVANLLKVRYHPRRLRV